MRLANCPTRMLTAKIISRASRLKPLAAGAILVLALAILAVSSCQPVPDAGEESAKTSRTDLSLKELKELEKEGKLPPASRKVRQGLNLTSQPPFNFDDFTPGTSFKIGDPMDKVVRLLGQPCEKLDVTEQTLVLAEEIKDVDGIEEWRYYPDCSSPPPNDQPEGVEVQFLMPWKLVYAITSYSSVRGQGLDDLSLPRIGKIRGKSFREVRTTLDLPEPGSGTDIEEFGWRVNFYTGKVYLLYGRVGMYVGFVEDLEKKAIVAVKVVSFSSVEDLYDLIEGSTGRNLRYGGVS